MLDESIAQARPRYFAFIGSSGLEIGALGDLLAHTYDINLAVDARAATQIEDQAVRWVSEFVGFPASAGAFTSGGTVSNVTALAAARERALPGSRHEGLAARRAAVYCSQEVHYSVTRAVELLGIGSANLRAVAIDGLRRMQPDALADAIAADVAAGITPIAVVATAGTTLTGAIDPIDEIADVCAEHGVWLHVDGAYGLPAATAASRAPAFEGSGGPIPARSTPTSGCICPRPAGSCSCATRKRSRTPSRTSRATCRTSDTSCTPPTSRSSTRGRSAR